MAREAWITRFGPVPYPDALEAQRELADARRAGLIPDTLLLLEHPPVYTKGRRHDPAELPMGEDWYRMQGIEVCQTDRGGRVTYHGPGQLVGYPIVDLSAYADDVHAFVRRLEQVMINALAGSGISAQTFSGLAGVWTPGDPPIPFGEPGPQGTPVLPAGGPSGVGSAGSAPSGAGRRMGPPPGQDPQARKVGAIGVHVAKGITTHGFAVNVSNDLQPFEWIVPCGIEAARATSLSRELGAEQSVEGFANSVADAYEEIFEVDLKHATAADLTRLVPAAAVLADAAVISSR